MIVKKCPKFEPQYRGSHYEIWLQIWIQQVEIPLYMKFEAYPITINAFFQEFEEVAHLRPAVFQGVERKFLSFLYFYSIEFRYHFSCN